MTELLKNKKTLFLIISGLCIGLLLIMSDSLFTSKKIEKTYSENKEFIDNYTKETEEKLKDLIESINGVSNVKVMITLKGGNEIIYAKDNGSDGAEKYVINSDSPLYISEKLPEIQGVAIVCKGGKKQNIRNEITHLVTSALGIYSTHVYVTE